MKNINIYGSGPAGLMCATELSCQLSERKIKAQIHIHEKRASYGRKLLIAGSSGLNITHDLPLNEFATHYQGFNLAQWQSWLESYGPQEWIRFINEELQLETFLGTSGRYFVKEMKASGLLSRWIQLLKSKNIEFIPQSEWISFKEGWNVLALGGGSWEDKLPEWPSLFVENGIRTNTFKASNVGFEVNWNQNFLKESLRKPIKNCILKTLKGSKKGELMITENGIEGTPVYFVGTEGECALDLKPQLSSEDLLLKLKNSKENLSPHRRLKKLGGLCEASLSLLYHEAPHATLEELVSYAKNFKLDLLRPRPLQEAISSKGGVGLEEINQSLALHKFPQTYCIGEMLDWDAPTGGFLIQAAVTQAVVAARDIALRLSKI